jgi:MoxR-like ATPase
VATPLVDRAVQLGASPRGIQALILLGKVRALLEGRFAVSCSDIRAVAAPALRHRLLLSFDALTDGTRADDIIAEVLQHTSELTNA